MPSKRKTAAKVVKCTVCHWPEVTKIPNVLYCPHCGGTNYVGEPVKLVYNSRFKRIQCNNCHTTGPSSFCLCTAVDRFAAHSRGREEILNEDLAAMEDKQGTVIPITETVESLFNQDKDGFITVVTRLLTKANVPLDVPTDLRVKVRS